MMEYKDLEEIHKDNKYISQQGIIFSDKAKDSYKELALYLSNENNLNATIQWLNSEVTERKWNNLYDCLKLLENEHKKNMEVITNLLGVDKCIDNSGALEAITYLQQSLNTVGFMLMNGIAIASNMKTLIAKENRAKQDRTDPNIEKARERAQQIWQAHRSQSLLDTAYQIKQELDLRKSPSTIQEWIRDLNPNAKKKSK